MFPSQLKAMIGKGEPVLIVDVREEEELTAEPFFSEPPLNYSRIPLGLFFLSEEELTARLDDAAAKMGKKLGEVPIVLVCHSGNRSGMGVLQLGDYGIRAENLEGGWLSWKHFQGA
jgi:rhodanese-related sulfurtransferase